MADIFDTLGSQGDIFDTLEPEADIFDELTTKKWSTDTTIDAGDFTGPMSPDQVPKPPEKRTPYIKDAIKDTGIAAITSAINVPEAVLGILDIPTLGRAGKFAKEVLKIDPGGAKKILEGYYSDTQKQAMGNVKEAKGFWNTIGTVIKNPRVLAQTAIESAALMGTGGAAARGIMSLAPKVSPWIASAIGEGLVGAGLAAESTRQQTEDGTLSAKQSLIAATSGAGTGLLNAAGGRLAKRFDFDDINTMLATGKSSVPKRIAESIAKDPATVAKRIGAGIATEAFEELTQSGQEQAWANAALDRPLMAGVPEAMALGALVGGAMGGGANLATMGGAVAQDPGLNDRDTAVMDQLGEAVNQGLLGTEEAVAMVKKMPGMDHLIPEIEKLAYAKGTERRQYEVDVKDDRRKADRRIDEINRKKISDMTMEERAVALEYDHKTGMRNKRSYDESDKLAVQASIDIDGLGWVNDSQKSHAAGDELIRIAGRAFAGTDLAYHISGDEFVVQGATQEEVDAAIKTAEEFLAKEENYLTLPDGRVMPIHFTYGTADNLDQADKNMLNQKLEKTKGGLRAEKGKTPLDIIGEAPAKVPELSGIDYTPKYMVEDSGEVFVGETKDAAIARYEVQQKQEAYEKLRDCLST